MATLTMGGGGQDFFVILSIKLQRNSSLRAMVPLAVINFYNIVLGRGINSLFVYLLQLDKYGGIYN